MNLKERFLSHQYSALIFFVAIYLLLTIPFLSTSPLIWADEGLLSEISWHLVKDGVFAQPLWAGYLGFEHFSVHPNYLYFLFLAFSFKILGVGIFQARLVSVLSGLFLMIFFYLFVEKMWRKKEAQIATILLFLNPLFILSARIVRQEMVTALFAFLAISFAILGLKKNRNNIFLAGIFAGLTILAHLNGVFVSFAVLVLLFMKKIFVRKREWNVIGYFILGITIALLPYLIFITIHWDIFFLQFSNMWSYRLPTGGAIILRNLLYEPQRWLKGITTPLSLAIGIIAFLYFLPKIKKLQEIYIPLVVMILCYAFFDYHKYYGYFLLILPLFCLLSGRLFAKYISYKNTRVIALIALLLISVGYVGVEEYKVWRDLRSDYTAYCNKIKEIIDKPGVILGDNLYWFCFPDGNLRDIIIPQVWLHDKEGKSSQEIFAFQYISYVILDSALNIVLHQNKAVFKVPFFMNEERWGS